MTPAEEVNTEPSAEEVNTQPDEVENPEPNNVPTTKAVDVATNKSPAEETSPPDNEDDDIDDNSVDEPGVEIVVEVEPDNSTNSYNTTSSGETVNKTSFKGLALVLLAIFYSL